MNEKNKKICCVCQIEKNHVKDFYLSRGTPMAFCKDCHKTRVKGRKEANIKAVMKNKEKLKNWFN